MSGPCPWPHTGRWRPFEDAQSHAGDESIITSLGQKLASQVTVAMGVGWELDPFFDERGQAASRSQGSWELGERRVWPHGRWSDALRVTFQNEPPHSSFPQKFLPHLRSRETWTVPCACHVTLANSRPSEGLSLRSRLTLQLCRAVGESVTSRCGWPTAERLITTINIPRGLLGARGARERGDSEHTHTPRPEEEE